MQTPDLETTMSSVAALIIDAASLSEAARLKGFRIGLINALSRWKYDYKRLALDAGNDEAAAIAFADHYEDLIWPFIFSRLDELEGKAADDLLIPFDFWRGEAVKIGNAFAEQFALNGPMEERKFARALAKMHKGVCAKAKELTNDWPISLENQKTLSKFLIASADEVVMAFMSSVQHPFERAQ